MFSTAYYFLSSFFFILPITTSQQHRVNPLCEALYQMSQMAKCALHYDYSVYDNYGCYCGVKSSGSAIDGIDRCCQQHDQCYTSALKVCPSEEAELFCYYNWSCNRSSIVCQGSNTHCQASLCLCDRANINCLSHYPKPSSVKSCPN